MENNTVTLRTIKEAAEQIQYSIRRTPLEASYYYSSLTGGNITFKYENLQVTGSFKVRGALNKLITLSDSDFDEGAVTVSAGNHALGFAFACSQRGKKGKIILPDNASPAKVETLKQFPVDCEFRGSDYDEAEQYTIKMVKEKGWHFVSPYNDPAIIAGQGTIGLEILEDQSECDCILVPVGGGGLIAGIALAAKSIRPEIKIYGIQSEASPAFKRALEAGKIVETRLQESVADGLHGNIEPGSMTFPIVHAHVEDILLVSENEIMSEFKPFIQNHHSLIEGSAAAIPAAVRKYSTFFKDRRIAGVLSGANIDVDLLKNILMHEDNTI
ncbi:threonine/serine dehydratase [candidate division KSB1 bacterium]